jgi:hypothetical protein
MPHFDVLVPQQEVETALDEVRAERPLAPGVVLLGYLAAVMFAVSFFLPALHNVAGYEAFVYALLWVICIPMWAANPVFWCGLAYLSAGRYRSAGKAGLAALLLALSESWMFWGELEIGYWIWAGSMAVLAVAGLYAGGTERRPQCWPALPGWRTLCEAGRIASRFRR